MAVDITVQSLQDAPAPRCGITITGLGVGASVVSVWRTVDGVREPVRGGRRVPMSDAAYLVDWDAPIGRKIYYEAEVISGPNAGARVTAGDTLFSTTGWLMDPLIPQGAVPISKRYLPTGQATFAASALARLEYAADVQLFNVLGSNKPLALFGQRMAAAGVDVSLITDAAEESAKLRDLLTSAGQLLLRVPAGWADALPPSSFLAVSNVTESPIDGGQGGTLTAWELTGDTVAAPTIKVLTASFTYGDVALLFGTYQQKQDAMAGKTYLDDLKNPLGG